MPSDTPYIDPNDPNMGSQDQGQSSAAQSTEQLQNLNTQVASHPTVQAFLRSRAGRPLTQADMREYQQLVTSLGFSMLPNTRIDPSGAIVPNNSGVPPLMIVAAFAWPLAAAGIQALGGGAVAATSPNAGLAGSGYVVPSAALGSAGGVTVPTVAGAAAPTIAGTSATSATGTAGAGAAGGKFSTFLRNIGGGRTLADIALGGAGLYLQNRQANNALDASKQAQQAQNDAAQKAIDLQKEMYQTTRNDLAPYRALGQGASAGLGYFMGIPGYEQGNRGILPPSAMGQPMTPPATPAASGNTAVPRNPSAATASEPMVAMRAPDGSMRAVPQSQVSHYQARGAQVAQ